jgi:biopolymer transport protein ExbB
MTVKEASAEVKRLEKVYADLKQEFESLLDTEKKLTDELENRQDEIKALEGAVRASVKDADEMIRSNPVTAGSPERVDTVAEMMDSKRFPGIESIKSLADIYFHEMRAGGEIDRYQGMVVAQDGSELPVNIIRLGRFSAYYKSGDGYGLLKSNAQGDRLIAVSGRFPSDAADALEDGEVYPMDFSGGVSFQQLEGGHSFLASIKGGGVLAYPIIGVGLIALVLILERAFVLTRIKSTSTKRMDNIMACAEKNDWEACNRFCDENSEFPTCRVLRSTMAHLGETQEVIENAMQEAILRELPRMERFLPTLSILAAVAPLLGLLGTVTGMINTFNILTIFGTGDPRMMSGGISEALITTQLGLAVAIPVMLCHHMLERRVDRILSDIEEKGTRFTVAILKNEKSRSMA